MNTNIDKIIGYLNNNSGVTSVIIFILTIVFGWISGIFNSLLKVPKLKIELIEGPTFCSTFESGEMFKNCPVHKTAIALYIKICNVGKGGTSIKNVSVGYHNYSTKFTFLWFWLDKEIISFDEYRINFGDKIKIFPFLRQQNDMIPYSHLDYLQIGQCLNGISYFEQNKTWGSFLPRIINKKIRVKVKIADSFGKNHCNKFWIPVLDIDEARKFNPSFGQSLDYLSKMDLKPRNG
jgi:hypothetical protein